MNLKMNKRNLKNLSAKQSELPADMTPQVGGGIAPVTIPITIRLSVRYCHTVTIILDNDQKQ